MNSSPDAAAVKTIKALAAARGLTHADIAEATGIAKGTLDRRMTKGGWSLEESTKLAELFGVGLDDLTTGLGGQLIPESNGGQ